MNNINKENNSEDITIIYNDQNPSYYNIRLTFDKIIGNLATATLYKPFNEKQKEYKNILPTVIKWSAEYELKRNLAFINHEKLLELYNKLVDLNDEIGYEVETEIAEQLVYWYWNLMVLRKSQIEKKRGEN